MKTGGRNFPVGNSFGGRPRVSPEAKMAKLLTRQDFAVIMNKLRGLTHDELKHLRTDGKTPIFEQAMIAWLIKAGNGDMYAIERLLDRLIGKVKDEIDVKVVKPFVVEHEDRTVVLGADVVEIEDKSDE